MSCFALSVALSSPRIAKRSASEARESSRHLVKQKNGILREVASRDLVGVRLVNKSVSFRALRFRLFLFAFLPDFLVAESAGACGPWAPVSVLT